MPFVTSRDSSNFDPAIAQAQVPESTSGLQWFAESLDKPAAAVRSLLHGDPAAALWHVTPFSDTIGGMLGYKAPERYYFGDTLRKSGWEDNWKTSLAGFGLDMITDPTLLFGANMLLPGVGKATLSATGKALGYGKRAFRGMPDWAAQFSRVPPGTARAGAEAAEAGLDAERMVNQFGQLGKHADDGAPVRKMFGGWVLPFGVDRWWNKSGEAATWSRNLLPGRAGEIVAEQYANFMVRNLVTRLLRRGFSATPLVGAGGVNAYAKATAEAGLNPIQAQAIAGNAANAFMDGANELRFIQETQGHMADLSKYISDDIIQGALKSDNVIDAANLESGFRGILEGYAPVETAVEQIRRFDSSLYQPIETRLSQINKLSSHPGNLDTAQRAAALSEQEGLLTALKQQLLAAGVSDDLAEKALRLRDEFGNPQVVQKVAGTLESLMQSVDRMHQHMFKEYGVHLGNFPGGYFPRQLTGTLEHLNKPIGAFTAGGDESVHAIARKPWLINGSAVKAGRDSVVRDISGTQMVNSMSSDPVLVGKNVNFSDEALKVSRQIKTTKPIAPPRDEIVGSVVKLGDDVGFVQSYDKATDSLQVKRIGKEGIDLNVLPQEVTGIFDRTHDKYGSLLEFAGYDLQRTGAYSSEAAFERMRNTYQYTYKPTAEELAGVAPEAIEATTRRLQGERMAELHSFLAKQPLDILQKGGAFNNSMALDLRSYANGLAQTMQTYEYTTSLFAHAASAENVGVSIAEMLPKLHGGDHDMPRLAAAYVKKLQRWADGQVGSEAAARIAPNPKIAKALSIAMEKARSNDPLKILEHLYVPPGAADLAKSWGSMFTGPQKEVGELVGMIRDFTTATKAVSYGLWPASRMRDLVGGAIQSIASGMFSAKNMRRAFKMAVNPSEPWQVGKHSDVLHLLMTHGVLDGTLSADQGGVSALKALGNKPLESIKEFTSSFTPKDAMSALGLGRLEGRIRIGAPEIQKRSKMLGSMTLLGAQMDAVNRGAAFATLLEKGWEPAQAAAYVKQVHFDYTSLGNIDRQIKDYVPFWSWMRKNLPAQVRLALENSGSPTAIATRLGAGITRENPDLPKGYEESTSFTNPAWLPTKPGQKMAINVKGLFPWEDLHTFGTTGDGLLGQIPGLNIRTAQKMGSMMTPPVVAGIQALSGIELYSGQNIRDTRMAQLTGSPQLAQAINSVLSRPISYMMSVADAAKAAATQDARGMSIPLARLAQKTFFGGIRSQEYYPDEEILRKKRETLEAYLKTKPGVGFFERPFIRETADPALQDVNRLLAKTVEEQSKLRASRR